MIKDNRSSSVVYSIACIFIILQPILDLCTSLSIRLWGNGITVGLFFRFAFLVLMGAYLMVVSKRARIYIGLLAAFFVLHLLINHALKPAFFLTVEVKYILKLVYFVVTLLFYFVLLLDRDVRKEKIVTNMVIAITIISVVMVLSGLTNTAFESYQGGKEGHVGWFYAGNEIGAILAMGFPVVVMAALKKSNWFWIPAVFLVYSLFALGTKVGFGAMIIVLIIALLMSIIDFARDRTRLGWIRSLIVFGLLFGTICYLPFSPLAKNMNMHLSWLGLEDSNMNPKQPVSPVTEEQVENLVYSGREKFLTVQKHYFSEAPLSQKIFGMGYGGNYQKEAKLVEMDFYDVFFSFGILGFLLYFLPLGFILTRMLVAAFRNIPQSLDTQNVLLASGTLLGIGIAYTAGHVLTAPGVSIYLALLLSFSFLNRNTN